MNGDLRRARLTAPGWTDATITPRASIVRGVHITELRSAVLALE